MWILGCNGGRSNKDSIPTCSLGSVTGRLDTLFQLKEGRLDSDTLQEVRQMRRFLYVLPMVVLLCVFHPGQILAGYFREKLGIPSTTLGKLTGV